MRTESTHRRGQALIELAVGMVVIAMVVSALCGFAVFIAKSLEYENAFRSKHPQSAKEVETGIYLGGGHLEKMKIKEL